MLEDCEIVGTGRGGVDVDCVAKICRKGSSKLDY